MKIVYLDKKHEPHKNEALISKYVKDNLEHRDVPDKTDRLFEDLTKSPFK